MNTPLMNCYNGCAEKFSGPTMILLQNILIVSLIIILVGLSSWLYQDDGGDFNWDSRGKSWEGICDSPPYEYLKPFEFELTDNGVARCGIPDTMTGMRLAFSLVTGIFYILTFSLPFLRFTDFSDRY